MLTILGWANWKAITAKVLPLRWKPSMQISVSSVTNSPLFRRSWQSLGDGPASDRTSDWIRWRRTPAHFAVTPVEERPTEPPFDHRRTHALQAEDPFVTGEVVPAGRRTQSDIPSGHTTFTSADWALPIPRT